jgi:hypothetical protein
VPIVLGTVAGTVTLRSTCGAAPVGGSCGAGSPQPLQIRLAVTTRDGATVASTESSPTGSYSVSVPGGSYTLVASQPVPACPPTPFTVNPGATTTLDVSCDAPFA